MTGLVGSKEAMDYREQKLVTKASYGVPEARVINRSIGNVLEGLTRFRTLPQPKNEEQNQPIPFPNPNVAMTTGTLSKFLVWISADFATL